MIKKICDMCGKDASKHTNNTNTYNRDSLILTDNLLCDNEAKIEITIITHLVNHSTGYGGPPDLCNDCFIKCSKKLLESMT